MEKVNHRLAIAYRKAVNKLIPDEGDSRDALLILDESEIAQDGEIFVAIRQEYTAYDSIRSTISHLFTATGVDMPKALSNSMKRYIKGPKRLNLMAKQTTGLDISEGKKCMSEKVYRKLCEILFRSDKREYIFAHLFFVLDWYEEIEYDYCFKINYNTNILKIFYFCSISCRNLMKRAENVVDCKISHIHVYDKVSLHIFGGVMWQVSTFEGGS